jgi:CRP-like cAMP-binding protein
MMTTMPEFKNVTPLVTLRNCPLFARLSAPDVVRIACMTVTKSLAPGEYLFRENAPSHGFYIIQQGAINLHRVSAVGKEQVIHIYRAGESLAEETLASATGHLADARAVERSQVLLVRKVEFLELVKHQPELGLRVLGSIAAQLRLLIGQLEDCTLNDVETRLANWLLKHCPNAHGTGPVTIQLPSTKRVIAAELGTVSETLSRAFAKLRDAHIISVNGKSLTLLDPVRLKCLFAGNSEVTWVAA